MAFTRSGVLLVLCAVLATAAAKEWHEGVLYFNEAKAATPSSNTQAKLTGDYQSPELRQICLRETKDNNCIDIGCPDALDCLAKNCSSCQTEFSFQTEFACCRDKVYDSFSSKASGAAGDLSAVAPSFKVGVCDWTVDTYWCDQGIYGTDCTNGFPMESNAEKGGSAWATCYFNSESESCGHPSCDKMVMSFQGGYYSMLAYTEGEPQAPATDTSCADLNGDRGSVLQRTVQHSKFAQKFLRKDPTALKRLSFKEANRRAGDGTKYYLGVATVVTGPVTTTSLYHNMDYNRGMLEYIADFAYPEEVSSPPAGLMPVVPYTMTITLASSKGSYDSYQPQVDEGTYDSGGYHN